jgi:hypothetical protein
MIMNDEKLQSILRQAPTPAAPDGLLERLQSDIRVTRPSLATPRPEESVPWLRRWLPAFGVAVLFLACAVALAVQGRSLGELRAQNDQLRASLPDLEQLRRDASEHERLSAENAELQRLRKDARELQQLREEVARLRAQVQEITRLRAENQQLAAGALSAPRAETDEEFFARVGDPKAEAMSTKCINNLKQIGLAARIWATDNSDTLPPNWLSMSNELSTPKVLVCPADQGRSAAPNWASFTAANVSYEFLNSNSLDNEPNAVLARCPVHGHVTLGDGSVQNGSGLGKTFTLTVKDGKTWFTSANQPPVNYTELMRQRYGLVPRTNLTAPIVTPDAKARELMMKRYGLVPADPPPGDDAPVPEDPQQPDNQ